MAPVCGAFSIRIAVLQVIVQAGTYVKEEVCRALVVLVSNASELHAYAARLAMQFLKSQRETASHSLLITSTWFIGEPLQPMPLISGPVTVQATHCTHGRQQEETACLFG